MVDSTTGNGVVSVPSRTPPSHTFISNVTFVVFDTETTGFSPTSDRIVEVGAVKFRNGKVLEEKSWLINPGRYIPYRVQQVHGISNEMVQDKPPFKDVYPEFLAFIKDCVLMAHNAKFDIRFVREEAKRNGLVPPSNNTIDSLPLFRNWYPDSKSYTLEDLAHYTQIDSEAFHRAEADALYVFLIFEKGLKEHKASAKLRDIYDMAGGALDF